MKRRETIIDQKTDESEAVQTSRAERLNTALFKKMFAAQEKYKAWLLTQTPEEILNHTYEYTMREDILLWLEDNDLEPSQTKALLRLPDPLAAVFKDLERQENSHMDDIADVFEDRANREIEKQRGQQSDRSR